MATKFAEVIYETGSHAVLSYDDSPEGLAEFKSGLAEQQRRATSGAPGGPTGHSAERITKVLLYNEHPGDFQLTGLVNTAQLKSDMSGLIDKVTLGDQVSMWEVIAALRTYMSAIKPKGDPHDSIFKMQESGELELEGVTS